MSNILRKCAAIRVIHFIVIMTYIRAVVSNQYRYWMYSLSQNIYFFGFNYGLWIVKKNRIWDEYISFILYIYKCIWHWHCICTILNILSFVFVLHICNSRFPYIECRIIILRVNSLEKVIDHLINAFIEHFISFWSQRTNILWWTKK